jgi:hypothetical protein
MLQTSPKMLNLQSITILELERTIQEVPMDRSTVSERCKVSAEKYTISSMKVNSQITFTMDGVDSSVIKVSIGASGKTV